MTSSSIIPFAGQSTWDPDLTAADLADGIRASLADDLNQLPADLALTAAMPGMPPETLAALAAATTALVTLQAATEALATALELQGRA